MPGNGRNHSQDEPGRSIKAIVRRCLPSLLRRRLSDWQFLINLGFLLHCSERGLGAELPPLVFLGDKDYPPVAYLEEGIAKGMDVDLAKELAVPMKREIRVELMDWNLAQEKVLKGEADGLLGLSISDERRKLFDFADPTFTREFGLVVRSGEMTIHDAGDLEGRSVGVTAGGFPRKFLESRPRVNLVLIENYQDGFDRLAAGTIDAMGADLWVAAYLMEKGGIRGVTIVGKPFAKAQGAIAVKKGNLALLNEINQAIKALKSEGSISKIQNDWRPQEMVFASRERIRGMVTRGVGIAMIILLVGMGLWIFTLEKQIRTRKKAESELRASDERFQLAVRGSTDGLWDRNILTNEVFYSDRYRELLGHSMDEFPAAFASFESRLHPDDKDRVLKLVSAHLEQREPYDAEYRLRTKSGEYRWFRGRGQAVWNEKGQAVRMAGSITDITDRKRAGEALRESEAQFRAIFENAAIGVSLADLSGHLVKCNPALQRLLGYTESELQRMNFAEVTHPEDVNADLRLFRALVAGEFKDYQIEKRYIRKNGQPIWVRLTVSLVRPSSSEPQFAIGMVEDITLRKQAESLTNTQMQVLEMIASGRPMTETLTTLLRMIETQSEEMLCSILLLERDGLHVRHGAAPSLPPEYLKAIDGSAIGPSAGSCGTAAFRREEVFVADIASDPLWADYKHLALPHGLLACWSTPIFDSQRNVLGTFAIYYRKRGLPDERHLQLIDVATHTAAVCIAKHRADEALLNSEESLRATIQNTPNVAVQWFDHDGKVMFWNRASELLYGWTADEAVGKPLDQLIFDRADAEIFHGALREIARTGSPVGPVEFPFHHRNGQLGIVLSTLFRIQLPTGEARFVCMDVDLTDRKRAEVERTESVAREQRAREEFTQKLIVSQEAERRRIAGELHDSLGQNLLLVKNRAQLALSSAQASPDVREQLEGIRDVAAQAIAEVRQIAHALHPYQLDHLGLTRALEAMIENAAQSTSIAFKYKLDSVDNLFSPESAANLYRVAQECLTNALKHAQAGSVEIHLERDVRDVRLVVKDNGRGFAREQSPGGGSAKGLGLKHIAERIRILNGTLQIESSPGSGTTIEVLIPIPREK